MAQVVEQMQCPEFKSNTTKRIQQCISKTWKTVLSMMLIATIKGKEKEKK
jgi:hypothetical protein